MKKLVFVVHSAGPQGDHLGSGDLVAHLQRALGKAYRVVCPRMIDPDNPRYITWKDQIDRELTESEGRIVLVGHSLGGSVLIKYLAETYVEKPILGLCLVAAPYWGRQGWAIADFALPDDLGRLSQIPHIALYHSRDDAVVPFSHLTYYATNLPHATVRELDEYGHLFVEGCKELLSDIRQIYRKNKQHTLVSY
ncbi:alpha/beta fold hydrolase [Larkinella sp. VNQ87]|uniref:alpha/beta fold hydrolase n=1 Tax=Larkinella sp. VNQ87 TaxID=3400921 RepID=UPI003C01E4CC